MKKSELLLLLTFIGVSSVCGFELHVFHTVLAHKKFLLFRIFLRVGTVVPCVYFVLPQFDGVDVLDPRDRLVLLLYM